MHIKAVKTLFEAFDAEHELAPDDFLSGNITILLLQYLKYSVANFIFTVIIDPSMQTIPPPHADVEVSFILLIRRVIFAKDRLSRSISNWSRPQYGLCLHPNARE